MRRLTLGVMGHVDHGKTALVRALSGMETDRLAEERRRGVSIVLGFAHARLGEVDVDFIDMPGHERFVRAMVSGATGIEAALLVVAANEGVKPQTREHVEVARALGVRRILPVVSKADLVPAEDAAAVADAVERLLRSAGAETLPPQRVSIREPASLQRLAEAIAALADGAPPAGETGFPYLPVDRAFTIAGRGTVVTGTLRRGRLGGDDALVLAPGGAPVRIRGLQVHGAPVDAALPGQRVAVNLRGVEPEAVGRGMALAPAGQLTASRWLDVRLRAAREPEATLRTGLRVVLLAATFEVQARLRLLEGDSLGSGESGLAQLETAEPVALPVRERFVLRLASPAATLGGGLVIDPASRRRRRGDAAVLAALAALEAASPEEAVALTLADAGARGVAMARLVAVCGLARAGVEAAVAAAGGRRIGEEVVVAGAALAALAGEVLQALAAQTEAQPNGMALRRLAALLPHAAPLAVQAAAAALASAGRVRLEGGAVRLAPRRPDAEALARRDAARDAEVARRLHEAGLQPPSLAELSATPEARRALERLVRSGEAVRTLDRVQKRELVFHRDALLAARETLRPRLGPPGLTVGEAGGVLGVSRKFSVPLMEYFDAVRFTRRLGDRRVLGPEGRG